ncbi:MAG TPA: DUF362 domain-containing protein [Bryobacteraceae bacterium]|nr:DUF362 domain-containing protein [Bryobacteraceae bacterium]
MGLEMNRRTFLAGLAAAGCRPMRAAAPTAPVALAKCKTYKEYLPTMERMLDQLGGLGRLVKGKTVAIKINLTGAPDQRLGYLPAARTYWTHPQDVGAMIHLLDKAGARRVRVLEGAMSWPDTLEEFMLRASWDIRPLFSAAPKVEFFNTNLPFQGSKPYTRFKVPGGGHLFAAYDLNTAYDECDVLVSMTKMKEHAIAGITLSMKNSFGITPCTIYGGRSGADEPLPIPYSGRQEIVHNGERQPPKSSLPEINPRSPREPGYRVPRCVADLVAARPVHLAIVEGIESMAGGEGPWNQGARPCSPGVLIAGTNVVTVDAVGMAVLGFNPMAERGDPPFEGCDSTLRLAEELGVGTRDLKQIEVIGTPIEQAKFEIRAVPGGVPPGERRRRAIPG